MKLSSSGYAIHFEEDTGLSIWPGYATIEDAISDANWFNSDVSFVIKDEEGHQVYPMLIKDDWNDETVVLK